MTRTTKPKPIGSINCFIVTRAIGMTDTVHTLTPANAKRRSKAKEIRFTFDGTIKNMVQVALAKGLKIGDMITTEDNDRYLLCPAPGDHRASETWADRIWK